MAQRSVMVRLDALVTPYIAGMGKASAATAAFARSTDAQLTKSTAQANKLGQAAGFLPSKFGALATVGGAAFAGIGLAAVGAVRAFSNFDVAMDAVAASTGATGGELEQLGKTALSAAADTKFGATEAARGIEALGKAGVSTADIIGGGLKGALDLAAAGEVEVAEAAELAAGAMTQFGLAGRDVPHIADLMAAAAGKAQGDVSDMALALKQSGLVASQMGLSIEETSGTLAAFASNALIGSDAGTSLRTMLLRLMNPSGKARDLMDSLGIAAYDAQGNFVGMESLAGQLQLRLGGLTQAQRDAALATIFGSDAIRAANVLYQQGTDGIKNWAAQVDDAGFAADQAAQRTDNLAGDMERLFGELETLAIGGGAAGEGPLRGLIQGAEDWISMLNEEIELWRTQYLPTIGDVENAINDFLPSWLELPDVISTTTEEVEEQTRAQALLGTELERDEAIALRYASQQEATTDATAALTEQTEELREAAFAASEQFLTSRDNLRGWEEAVDDASEALDENGVTLDRSTEKGRANEQALDDMAAAALRVLDDMVAAGENTDAAQSQMRTALVQTGVRFGMTEQDAEDYADQVISASKLRINTPVRVDDETARKKVAAWNKLIAAGGGQITVSIRAIERAAGAGGLGATAGFPLPGGPGAYRMTQGPHDGGARDWAASIGTPVFSTFGGYLDVTDLGNRSYGKYYTVRSGSRYELGAHLSAFARGDGIVPPRSLVGWTGNSGRSTGPHLHYLRNFHTGGWSGGGPINTLRGEFVVNPTASANNAALLEAINAGRGAGGTVDAYAIGRAVRSAINGATLVVDDHGRGRLIAKDADLLGRAG